MFAGLTQAYEWRPRGPVGPAVRRGLLHAVPVGAGLLLELGWDKEVAGTVATAALLAGFVAFDAPARIRLRWQLLFAPALGAAAALGALSASSDALAIATMTVFGIGAGYFVAVSPRLMVAGMTLALGLLLAQAGFGAGDALGVLLLATLGGLLQAAVALIAWLGGDSGTEDFDLGRGMRAAGRAFATELRPDSIALRHALRWGVALGAGVAVYRLGGFDDHGYWIPLTVLFVLRPDPKDTWERMVMRAAGTLAGLALATALAELIGDRTAIVVIVLTLAAALSLALVAIEYALFTTSITVFVVLLTDELGAPALQAADDRALATAIGIAICGAALLVWAPSHGLGR